MGILSDPDAGSGKWAKILIKIHRPICFICCIGAVVWFILLGNKTFNNANYFSENALLPGLVRSDFKDDGSAKQFYNEFLEELKDKYEDQDSIPLPWLVGKMSQLNLEVYTHNFTLNYPLGIGHTFTGTNVYGILRAPRSSSIEALVLTAPYRSLNSHHKGTTAGIALMLAFAKFARPQKYWAKDIIFLITEHEQLGIQAWLEAYHGIESTPGSFASSLGLYWKGTADDSTDLGTKKCLNAGKLKGRSGSIQAAINLELHSPTIKYIEVKVEGLNGQLPNLDLVNLVHKMCAKSSIHHAYRTSYSWLTPKTETGEWVNSLNTMVGMITTQIAGVPNGNHGLFHRFGIEAVTLEGRDASDPGPAPRVAALSGATFARLATILEGSLRSLNNLLERFHQSYFFYLMAATDRFISIGQYMPCLCLLCGALLVRALALWITIQRQHNPDDEQKEESKEKNKQINLPIDEGFNVVNIGANYLVVHLIGYFIMASPKLFSQLGATYYSLPTESGIYYSLAIQSALLVCMSPALLQLLRQTAPDTAEVTLLLTLALIQLSCVCLAIGMYNFSLGVCLAAVYTPVVLLVSVVRKERTILGTLSLRLKQILCILIHPLVLVTAVICCYTAFAYPDEGYEGILWRGIHASKEAITFSVVDGMIYGNWLFSVVASLILPMWTIFWQILNCPVD